MKLKNYTSVVDPEQSIARIDRLLIGFGALSIVKDFERGKTVAIRFDLKIGPNNVVTFRLPSRVDCVLELFKKEKPTYNLDRLKTQAERTAWKIVADWVDVQLSMIRLGQAKPAEVFMSYLWDGSRTLFAALEENNFTGLKMLAAPKENGGQ